VSLRLQMPVRKSIISNSDKCWPIFKLLSLLSKFETKPTHKVSLSPQLLKRVAALFGEMFAGVMTHCNTRFN